MKVKATYFLLIILNILNTSLILSSLFKLSKAKKKFFIVPVSLNINITDPIGIIVYI